ncbi:MAG TPA: hypothetical protein VKY40_00840 [Halanaerobiales bacterium]|nr:hypothetical protein [Halanaerobiales bacterium]
MSRMVYLVIFLAKNYWRRSNFLLQFLILAMVCGYFIDPGYAPYSYDYIVLIKNFALIIIAFITTFQMNKINYDRSIYVLLTRVKRKFYYLSAVLSSFIIVLGFSILLDIYILLFTGLSFYNFFTLSLIIYSILNIFLVIVVSKLFSVYTMGNAYQIVGLIITGFALIPGWYENLPFEKVLSYLNHVLPPLGSNILVQQSKSFFNWNLPLSILYLIIALSIGIRLFENRNLTDLK